MSRALANAMRGAQRAATLTSRLLAFSRRQALDPKPMDLNKFLVGAADFIQRSLGENVQVEVVGSPGLWFVEVDANQLEVALLNLAINGRDAMPLGGKLTIESANVFADENYSRYNPEIAPGQYVAICVTDNGVGMPSDVIDRAFEPFYTTKELGQGTGLGLSQVYGFVKQSGGHVKIYSEIGQGTTVKIYLPRCSVSLLKTILMRKAPTLGRRRVNLSSWLRMTPTCAPIWQKSCGASITGSPLFQTRKLLSMCSNRTVGLICC